MKHKKIHLINILKRNFREIIFVFLAFALMASVAYISVGFILRVHLLERAKEMSANAETNVRSGLFEAETILLNTYYIVNGIRTLSDIE